MSLATKIRPLAVATSLAVAAIGTPLAAQADLSGNIGVHSKYLLRGIFDENDATAVQGGLDYSHDSGFYAGYWFSNLGYTYDADTVTVSDGAGFENDFYGGFAGETAGGLGWDIGLIQYVYLNVDDSDLTELTFSLSYGGLSGGFQYLLSDGWWGNSGDVYWKLGYNTDLPKDFNLDILLGYYTYDDSDNSKLCNPAPEGCGATTEDSAFRHLTFTLGHPIGKTGADWYIAYTFAGDDRGGNSYDDSVVAGITYGFDI